MLNPVLVNRERYKKRIDMLSDSFYIEHLKYMARLIFDLCGASSAEEKRFVLEAIERFESLSMSVSQRQEHEDTAPHENCQCKLCFLLRDKCEY